MRGRWGVRSGKTASASTTTRVTEGEYVTATVTPLQPWHSGQGDGAVGRVWVMGLSSAQPSGHATRSSVETVASKAIRSAANTLLTTAKYTAAPVLGAEGLVQRALGVSPFTGEPSTLLPGRVDLWRLHVVNSHHVDRTD
jgi:hypothetical protein